MYMYLICICVCIYVYVYIYICAVCLYGLDVVSGNYGSNIKLRSAESTSIMIDDVLLIYFTYMRCVFVSGFRVT